MMIVTDLVYTVTALKSRSEYIQCELDYEILFNYLQLCRSYAILSATTQRAFRS